MINKYTIAPSIVIAVAPAVAYAQGTSVQSLISALGSLITSLFPLVGGIALLVFLWGLAKFIKRVGAGDEKAVEDGKRLMVWGIIALFVLASVWGIVAFIQSALGLPASSLYAPGTQLYKPINTGSQPTNI